MSASSVSGIVFDVKELTVHDGPGLRTTVFLKGCPLRCLWCHNPEGLAPQPELLVRAAQCTGCGRCRTGCGHPDCQPFGRCLHVCPLGLASVCGEWVEAGALAARVRRGAAFLENGGVTLSGGEPLQQPDFAEALLRELEGLHRAVETSGFAPPEVFDRVIGQAELVLFDCKHTDPARHKALTGVDNAPILHNLRALRESGKPFVLRVPLIPGYTDAPGNLAATADLAARGGNLVRVELLRYNPFAGAKYSWVGRVFSLPELELQKPPDLRPFTARGIEAVVL